MTRLAQNAAELRIPCWTGERPRSSLMAGRSRPSARWTMNELTPSSRNIPTLTQRYADGRAMPTEATSSVKPSTAPGKVRLCAHQGASRRDERSCQSEAQFQGVRVYRPFEGLRAGPHLKPVPSGRALHNLPNPPHPNPLPRWGEGISWCILEVVQRSPSRKRGFLGAVSRLCKGLHQGRGGDVTQITGLSKELYRWENTHQTHRPQASALFRMLQHRTRQHSMLSKRTTDSQQ